MKRLLPVFLLLIVCVSIAGVFVWKDYNTYLDSVVLEQDQEFSYQIERGTAFNRITDDLQRSGLLEKPLYWRLYAVLQKQTSSIKAGEYRLTGPLTPKDLLDRLIEGRTVQFSLTIPEGWTFSQLLQAVQQHSKIISTLDEGDDVMAMLGSPGEHPEGWFLPETYHFPRDTTDIEFLDRSYRAMKKTLSREWANKSPDLPLSSPYEALILASIVEKETAVEAERAQIAGVFVSRLKKGMLLQTDPTVIYGMGDSYDGNIRKRDLKTDTPYNTYVRPGLTPTPISLPGADAIHAVLHPADTNALYFVSRGDGSHHFSKTYREHSRAVARYQLSGRRKVSN